MGQSRAFYRLIFLPGFVGLACYACTPTSSLETSLETSLKPSPNKPDKLLSGSVEPRLNEGIEKDGSAYLDSDVNPPSFPSLKTVAVSTGSSAAYREGINLASSAYRLSQSAVSPDDWSLIANRWQRAADHLKKVNREDSSYKMAQQKIAEYARNASHAKAQLQALEQSVSLPLPPRHPSTRQSYLAAKTKSREEIGGAFVRTQVPIVRRLHGTPVIEVVFNGQRSYEMILDTGASRTLITRQMANELGIIATEKMIAATASESEVVFDIGQVHLVAVGQITLQDAKVSIGDSGEYWATRQRFLTRLRCDPPRRNR